MARPSHRDKILENGLRVVLERGFGGASVRDIVQAAGVPQGSFTNHFASKEAFGLEVLELYCANSRQTVDDTLRNTALAPLERLRAYFRATSTCICDRGVQHGCLFGNYSIEIGGSSEPIRLRLLEVMGDVRRATQEVLEAAVEAGELPPGSDCAGLAGFAMDALQGAVMMAKAERDIAPVQRCEQFLFSHVLAGGKTAAGLAPH